MTDDCCGNRCCEKTDDSKQSVDSTSDSRTVNNVMRHEYKILSDAEKAQMQYIKDAGLSLHNYLDGLSEEKPESREITIAKQKIEEAVMWGVKHITK